MSNQAGEVTTLLAAIKGGDSRASDRLLPLVYDSLRRLAQQMMGQERPGQTLQATALVHEAYLRLIGNEPTTWDDRRHFYGAAARAMRQILVERARRKGRIKHGGGRARVELDPDRVMMDDESVDHSALDEALHRLEVDEPRVAEVVMLRFYAGLGEQETAQAIGISTRTVRRDWIYAKAWLYKEMTHRDLGGRTP